MSKTNTEHTKERIPLGRRILCGLPVFGALMEDRYKRKDAIETFEEEIRR